MKFVIEHLHFVPALVIAFVWIALASRKNQAIAWVVVALLLSWVFTPRIMTNPPLVRQEFDVLMWQTMEQSVPATLTMIFVACVAFTFAIRKKQSNRGK